jgi:hypothetical protein
LTAAAAVSMLRTMAAAIQPSFVRIERTTLKHLYVEEGLTTSEVAARLGCSAMTIRRRLTRFHIPIRPRGPCPRHAHRRRRVAPVWSTWSPAIAYAIGLIATDGNLSSDGRHLSIPSKDLDLLETLRDCLRLNNTITRHSNERHIHRLQWVIVSSTTGFAASA